MLNPSTPRRPVLRYYGGKWRLAPWVVSHFPTHETYVEAYAGAASVLLRKQRSPIEVYNDLDSDVVNLFRVLRDPAAGKDLINLLRLTPFAREEFVNAYTPALDPIEQARRMVVRSFMGHGSTGGCSDHHTGFRNDGRLRGTPPVSDWHNYPDALPAIIERLRQVTVEQLPATEVMLKFDHPRTLHYVDPPYVMSSRSWQSAGYRHEMNDANHRELATVLRSLQGMVVLSGYPSDLYAELFSDWKRLERTALADGGKIRTEVLWLNPAAAIKAQGSLEL